MTSGLVQHYDGINNTRTGHSNITTVWEDLIGNNTGIVKINDWTSDCLQFNGNNLVNYKGDITNQYTIMGVFSYKKTTGLYPRITDSGINTTSGYPAIYMFNDNVSTNAEAWAFRFYGHGKDAAFTPKTSVPELERMHFAYVY